MRVAYISHSLVAQRQALFAVALRHRLQTIGGDLLEVYPSTWGPHMRQGGHFVYREGDIMHYEFPPTTWDAVARWQPTVLLVQNEAYCRVTHQALRYKRTHKVALVTFSWENQIPPDTRSLEVYDNTDLCLFGNTDAYELARANGLKQTLGHGAAIVSQVGIEPDLFQFIPDLPKEYDIGFAGRKNEPMKGEDILDAATANKPWRIRKFYQDYSPNYANIATKYRSVQVTCSPSRDLAFRPREQFAPAVNVESLFCGTPVVTTDQPAIHEWLNGCPAAFFAKQNDATSLRGVLEDVLDGPSHMLGRQGHEWAVKRFSNEVVSSEYVRHFQKVA